MTTNFSMTFPEFPWLWEPWAAHTKAQCLYIYIIQTSFFNTYFFPYTTVSQTSSYHAVRKIHLTFIQWSLTAHITDTKWYMSSTHAEQHHISHKAHSVLGSTGKDWIIQSMCCNMKSDIKAINNAWWFITLLLWICTWCTILMISQLSVVTNSDLLASNICSNTVGHSNGTSFPS